MWASRHAAKVALCLAERPADAEELPGYESHLAWLGYLPERGEDRAVRDPRRALMDAVDGNAIGGQLIDVFGTEMTAARGPAAPAGQWPNLSSTGGPRHRGPLPHLRQRPHGLRQGARRHLCRPGRAGQPGPKRDRPSASSPDLQIALDAKRARRNHTEGADMPHQESISMGTPDEESMCMGTDD